MLLKLQIIYIYIFLSLYIYHIYIYIFISYVAWNDNIFPENYKLSNKSPTIRNEKSIFGWLVRAIQRILKLSRLLVFPSWFLRNWRQVPFMETLLDTDLDYLSGIWPEASFLIISFYSTGRCYGNCKERKATAIWCLNPQ